MSLTKIKVNNTEVIGVDNEPIIYSNNLITSDGVEQIVKQLNYTDGYYYTIGGTYTKDDNYGCIKIDNTHKGDVIYAVYNDTYMTPCMCEFDINGNYLNGWNGNNGPGYRTMIVDNDNTEYVVVSFLKKDTFLPLVKKNNVLIWQRIDDGEIFSAIRQIQNKSNSARIGLVMPTGGTYIHFRRSNNEVTFPANTSIRYDNNFITLSSSVSIRLTHIFGYIAYRISTGTILDVYTNNLTDDYVILFSYSTAFSYYQNRLVSSLPDIVSNIDENYTIYDNISSYSAQLEVFVNSAKYDFDDFTDGMPLQFIWLSDIHGYDTCIHHALELKDRYSTLVHDVISTGDLQGQHYEDDFSFWTNLGANSFLLVIGNHEVWKNDGSYATAAEAYQKYFAPFINNWNVTSAGTDLNYYYKDYSNSHIRLIVLDCMNYDNNLNLWFIDTLNSAKTNNLNVIVALHYLADSPDVIECNYSSIITPYELGVINQNAPTAIDNFINNGGKFICWIGGHYHADYIYKLHNHPNQYGILIGTASTGQVEKNNYRHTGLNVDLFNIILFDTTFNIIKIFRVGAALDRWNRDKRLTSFNYKTGEVINS